MTELILINISIIMLTHNKDVSAAKVGFNGLNQHVRYVPNQGLLLVVIFLGTGFLDKIICISIEQLRVILTMVLYPVPCHAIVDYRINMQIYLRIEILQMLTFASSLSISISKVILFKSCGELLDTGQYF